MQAGTVHRFAGFVLDERDGVLSRPDGTEARLRPKAVSALCALVERQEQPVSRDALMRIVWPGICVTDDSITQCIAEIRRAMGEGASQILQTLPKRGYRLVLSGQRPASPSDAAGGGSSIIETPALMFPDRPSLAVLPFANLAHNPEEEFFSDGITDDIIARLARNRSLFVIARSSSFSYRSRSVSVRDIGQELGVRYVLEGSVRRDGRRIRINAQLIEANTGIHIWADSYDRDLSDVFAVQDEITQVVVTEIAPAITQLEQERAVRKPAANLNAWEAYQRGLWHTSGGGNQDLDLGAEYFQRAIALDPRFADPHAMLARYYNGEATRGGGRPLDEGLKLAELEARAALRLDATNTIAYAALAWVFNQRGDVANALEQAEHAIAINPNDPAGHFAKGHILVFARRSEAARSALGTALRLDPRGQAAVGPLHHLAVSHYLDGDYALAEAASRRSILTCPDFPRTYPVLAAALAQLGRPAEAANALRAALSDAPGYFAFLTGRRPPWYRPEDHAHLLDGLRKAGWPTRG